MYRTINHSCKVNFTPIKRLYFLQGITTYKLGVDEQPKPDSIISL